jgi:anaerobic ribonucleoside-triphosphate reductase activating protein
MESSLLNIAEICTSTRALGPGLRSAIWVQGCPIHCIGCIAPEWIPFKPANRMDPAEAAQRLLENPAIEGVTISGGEPTLQATGLAEMIRILRAQKELHIICFSGYHYEELLSRPAETGVPSLLAGVDLLIDGPYIHSLNMNTSFAGSSNQRRIVLSDRKVPDGDRWQNRKIELHIRDGNILTVGVPPKEWNRFWLNKLSLGFPRTEMEAL